MKLSRWTLFQIITISFLLAAGYALSYYRENISNQIVNNVPITLIISLSIIFGAVACTSLLFYFQTKKSSTFLIHPLWKKMHVLVGINILVSMILVIFLSVFSPMFEIVERRPWILSILGYYFLFNFNLFILSVLHRFGNSKSSPEKKVEYGFFGTLLSALIILFLLPSF